MILTVNDLPSGGIFGTAAPVVFRPFTFLEVMDYTNTVAGNSLKQYVKDINFLLKMDDTILKHSIYDLDYLIFMMKVHTISENQDFSSTCKCMQCKEESVIKFDLGDFKFRNIDPTDKKPQAVLLGGIKYKVKVPTIGTFMGVLEKYNLYNKVDNSDVIKLISLFPEFQSMPNDIEDAIFDANREDISVLYYLESMFLNSVEVVFKTCVSCNDKRGMAIRIESLIASMFREILFNNSSLESKILFE